MDKKELYKLLVIKEKQFEKAKEKRNVITILAFAIVFFVLLCIADKPTGLEYIYAAFAAIVIAAIHFLINGFVFSTLFQASESERAALDYMRKQLSE
jgi:hypothetical protein